jgi:hypothetical protein
MKKHLTLLFSLTVLVFGFALTSQSQNCLDVTSAQFTNPSGDNVTWRLTIGYRSNGTKNLKTLVFVGQDTVINTCFQSSQSANTGTIIYDNIISPNGLSALRAKFTRFTGTCENGTVCAGELTLYNNILDIKIVNLSARNRGNITEITFKVVSVDETARIFFNFYMPDGTRKKHEIKLPNARPEETWQVNFNNLTETYTAKKLK